MEAAVAPVNRLNPFAPSNENGTAMNAVSLAQQKREVAEVQAAMVIARMNPRDQKRAVDRILEACARPTLAAEAVYEYARGGTDISGPSIRLAEAIAQQWGNLTYGVRELEQRDGESVVEAFAWDLETNTRVSKTFQVPHVRYSKNKGNERLSDPRDIYEMTANMGARRVRACILAVIPGDVVQAAVEQCDETMRTKFAPTPDVLQKMLEAFAEFGVTKGQIEARIQRNLESVTAAQLARMKKIHTSLKDGMSAPADWFTVLPEALKRKSETAAAAAVQQAPITGAVEEIGDETEDPGPPPAAIAKPMRKSATTKIAAPPAEAEPPHNEQHEDLLQALRGKWGRVLIPAKDEILASLELPSSAKLKLADLTTAQLRALLQAFVDKGL